MSGQPDFALLPTPSDVLRVECEIRITEMNLKEAQLSPGCTDATTAELEKNLEVLKAWIAPIRRLNRDILSLVFELCGEDDWKTPLRIATTSRDWRDLVLATPRAWEFFSLPECENKTTIKLFVERSDPRPLHIALPRISWDELLSNISHRLECLVIGVYSYDMGHLAFPNLKRLVIQDRIFTVISWINASRYPALRHLVCLNVIKEADSFIDGDLLDLPPLQSLSLTIRGTFIWLSVLQSCQDTLTSLSLQFEEDPIGQRNVKLAFPRLTCLEIDGWGSGIWPLDMQTPILETFIEGAYGYFRGNLIPADFDTITQLRADRASDLFRFPMAKLIQLSCIEQASLLLRRLSSKPACWLRLEVIEVWAWGTPPDYIFELAAAVNRKLGRNISLLFVTKYTHLHNSITTQMCGPNMPCYYEGV